MAFKTSLAAKRREISAAKRRYEAGLEKLAFATESVNAMQARRVEAKKDFYTLLTRGGISLLHLSGL